MAPKRASKASGLRGTKPSPTLSMLFESPAKEATFRPTLKGQNDPEKKDGIPAKSSARSKMQNVSFADVASPPSSDDRVTKVNKGKERRAEMAAEVLPWCDLFAPTKKVDVAVHKKKIDQVRSWLREAFEGKGSLRRYRRILVLSGPAGCGKSTLLRALAHEDELDFQIVEWTNEDLQRGFDADFYWDRGSSRDSENQGHESVNESSSLNKLGSFLSSASRYSMLEMHDEEGTSSNRIANASTASGMVPRPRKILLLEDLPNVSHAPTKASFNAALGVFLQEDEANNIPLVIVLSESIPRLDDWGPESSARGYKERNEATLTVRSLLSERIRSSVGFTHIEFNAVASTILSKALKRASECARKTSNASLPAPSSAEAKDLIEAIVESAEGDLRSAMNTLQLISLQEVSSVSKRGTKRLANGKAAKKRGSAKLDKKRIALLNGKETSLVLFHALGKILYNKRRGDPNDEEYEEEDDAEMDQMIAQTDNEAQMAITLPPHMASLARRKSRVNPESLWRSMPTDSSTMQAFLHQNYTQFCESIEQSANLSEALSEAAMMKPAQDEWHASSLTDYYSFLTTSHAFLLHLPSPVSRNQHRKLKGAALFQKIKTLRGNTEKIQDIYNSLREEAQDVLTDSSLLLLSSASMTDLVCDILPILSRSHPDMVSFSIDEIINIPWTSTGLPQGDDDSLEDVDMADLPNLSQIETIDGTKQINVTTKNTAKQSIGVLKSLEAEREEEEEAKEEEDEIEDFD